MKRALCCLLSLLMMSGILRAASFSVYDLTCDNESNPVGIDNRHPAFSWKIFSPTRAFVQGAYQLLVADSEEALAHNRGTLWDSRRQKSRQSLLLPYGGKELQPATRYFWKVRIWDSEGNASEWSRTQQFTTGLFTEKDWGKSQWIALEADRADERVVPGCHQESEAKARLGDKEIGKYSLPQFRKSFTVKRTIAKATAYVAGLGHFDFFVNGSKVGDHFLDAAWANYDKLAYYVTFDITPMLTQGENVFGVMLGNGFYNVPRERYFKLLTSFGAPKMRLMAKIEYTDGTVQEVVSDPTWRTTPSPITYSSIYGGEDYDARLEKSGWMLPGYDAAEWQKPLVAASPAKMAAQRSTPLTIHSQIPAQRIFKNRWGHWVYDLGQNFSGIVRLTVRSDAPQTVLLRPAELLNADSTVNQSASGEPFYFKYTTHGGGKEESWQPQFTYYGFRYVEVEGAAPDGTADSDCQVVGLRGLHTCNSAAKVGTFSCSNPMFNQIHTLIDWAIRSNTVSVLTDCPHREKLGWLEEAHLMQHSLLYNYDLVRQYRKIMEDMSLAQRPDGCIPSICPEYVRFAYGFEDSPEWGSSFVICPWYLYRWYGDRKLIEEYYPAMKRYVAYLASKADADGIVSYGLGDWFDLGPDTPGCSQLTDKGVTATAMYFYDTQLMSKMARLLGRDNEAQEFEEKARAIKQAFNRRYLDTATGRIDRNSQTANAIALHFGLVDDSFRGAAIQNLVDDITSRGNALTAGDIGYRYVLRALQESGRSDVIYDMNSRYDVPGYGWQLAHGATALTESWQAYGFVSNNHFMLGHLMEWLYSGLAGIGQTDESVAFSEILIDPQLVGDVRSASATFESPYGTITSDWKLLPSGTLRLSVTIPANTTAKVVLPTKQVDNVTEHGLPLIQCGEIMVSQEAERLVATVPSGNYCFDCIRK